jgi:hypothetical protein
VDSHFEKQLRDSGTLHSPLPVETKEALESAIEAKKVIQRKMLWPNEDQQVGHSGRGSVRIVEGAGRQGKQAIELAAPQRYESWPEGESGHYSNYGIVTARLTLERENLEAYNRLSCWIKSDFINSATTHFLISIFNDGKKKLPDLYYREGVQVINLKNHAWNHIVWELPTVPRDAVTVINFFAFLFGENGATTGEVQYLIDEVELQAVEATEPVLGWTADRDLISYATAGYDIRGAKTAVSTIRADHFSVRRASDDGIVLTGEAAKHSDPKGELYSMDFSALKMEGEYTLEQNGYRTPVFSVRLNLYEELIWKTLNFLFCQRCGYPVPTRHGTCHSDMVAEHNGLKLVFQGGWHDAGDLSQFAVQTFEVVGGLFEIARKLDPDSVLFHRLIEEAEWGLDFVLRTRFGDGYRATSSGCSRYTNGLIGDFDDVDVRVHNHPIDNFISATTLAIAARGLENIDSGRSAVALKAAREDYAFAKRFYDEHGFVPPDTPWEHTYPTGEASFDAIASVAASTLYQVTGESAYAEDARGFANEMLQAQERGEAGIPLKGFFYRDRTKTQPQHFNHQSREHYYMQALVLLSESQPEGEEKAEWERAMKLYSEYLEEGARRVYPYALLPSGVYALAETNDRALFKRMSFACEYENELDNWKEQIKAGEPLGKDFYFRIFPAWHSFRGNAAVQLESGKAASLLGRYFGDEKLLDLGREQIYWLLGKNPFAQSVMYGVGKRYTQLYALVPGETVGALPVGISSYENTDLPYWPLGNNCTYKEIWTSSSRSLLWVIADLI